MNVDGGRFRHGVECDSRNPSGPIIWAAIPLTRRRAMFATIALFGYQQDAPQQISLGSLPNVRRTRVGNKRSDPLTSKLINIRRRHQEGGTTTFTLRPKFLLDLLCPADQKSSSIGRQIQIRCFCMGFSLGVTPSVPRQPRVSLVPRQPCPLALFFLLPADPPIKLSATSELRGGTTLIYPWLAEWGLLCGLRNEVTAYSFSGVTLWKVIGIMSPHFTVT
jgi:hypothetical protein